MKANLMSRHATLAPLVALAVLAGCSERRVVPSPAPAPEPEPTVVPPQPRIDWRQAPITPGTWTWGMQGTRSVARFADGLLTLSCDTTARTVTLSRAGIGRGDVPMTILTQHTTRPLTATADMGPPPTISVRFAASDRLLDAMAFSRGRFAVETAGLPTVYAPSWPEVSRVIEDCR
ncbi:hypothetical protein GCM10011371_23760 [Novosphingobium marinum]|uniref:Lipoprotein n=1 Tax=Novosphingobium marinum TaxID=1514948 RepID=A0A7Y9XXM5_9SPHN|nr:hypothetical protein [Novosphingobium marinum]NYH96491.1 hypothetical protein [Novosphingobium marinum]GGC35648.1 hypothetical protein GCM10011371_23760 [Novosphingobium marinum]